MVERKSEGISILLAFFPGICGWCGVGHLYAGKIGKGLGIMVTSLLLFIVTAALIIAFMASATKHDIQQSLYNMNMELPALLRDKTEPVEPIMSPIWIFTGLAYLGLFIWQMVDARAVCRRHNQQVTGGYYISPWQPQPPPGRM